MRSLFARIFLSFWLTMALIIVVSMGVASTVVWNRTVELQRIDINELAQAGEQRLHAQGLPGLDNWTKEITRQYPGLDVFVVRADGEQALQRPPMPEWLKRRVRAMQRDRLLEGPVRRRTEDSDPFRSAPQITGPKGEVYTLFFPPVRDVKLAVLGSPIFQLIMLLLSLAISGGICWYLARSVTRPVRRLQESARALADGNLDARVGAEFASRHDELSVLAQDFDQMADRLRGLIDSKEVLLRDVSHELRTPLARMRLALGLARREGANLEREHDRIEREAERLDELIGKILNLARLNATQQKLPSDEFDYAALIADLAEDARLEAVAQGKQVNFTYQGVLFLHGNEPLLRSAIENVVRNAVRYTAVGTAVELSLARQGGTATLMVRDHGPGVPEAELSRLFEPFYRVTQQARERDTGGYGLGLAITARVIAAHHGSIHACNAHDGGLQITLTVPLKSE